jgi:hypothetical protein
MSVISKNAPRCPLLLAALAYGSGILMGERWWRPTLWLLAAAVAFTLAAFIFVARVGNPARKKLPLARRIRGHVGFAYALAGVAALGAMVWGLRNAAEPNHAEWQSLTDGHQVTITGYVVNDGLLRGSGTSRRESVDIQVESAERQLAEETAEKRIAAETKKLEHRAQANCKFNAIWSPDLLKAAGMPVCPPESLAETRDERHDETNEDRSYNAGAPRERIAAEGIVRLSIYSREGWDEADDEEGASPPGCGLRVTSAIPWRWTTPVTCAGRVSMPWVRCGEIALHCWMDSAGRATDSGGAAFGAV